MTSPIDCACVIHGDAYAWCYVDNLFAMLRRHLDPEVRLHVFTEPGRPVPEPYIRHDLETWSGAAGPRRAWWYKLQLFAPGNFPGRVIYFDLDTVIIDSVRWLLDLDPDKFWSIRDFRWLWKPNWSGINSSVMVWDAPDWNWILHKAQESQIHNIMDRYAGDQDWLTSVIDPGRLRFFDVNRVQSWRWQILDGGMDMHTRRYHRPGAGPVVPRGTSIVVFHGRPKPHQLTLSWIQAHWQAQT